MFDEINDKFFEELEQLMIAAKDGNMSNKSAFFKKLEIGINNIKWNPSASDADKTKFAELCKKHGF